MQWAGSCLGRRGSRWAWTGERGDVARCIILALVIRGVSGGRSGIGRHGVSSGGAGRCSMSSGGDAGRCGMSSGRGDAGRCSMGRGRERKGRRRGW